MATYPAYANLVTVEQSATTTSSTWNFDVNYVDTIHNDGSADITFTFAGASLTLKSGEQVTDLSVPCTTISAVAASGTQAFRAWGLR